MLTHRKFLKKQSFYTVKKGGYAHSSQSFQKAIILTVIKTEGMLTHRKKTYFVQNSPKSPTSQFSTSEILKTSTLGLIFV